MDIQQYYAIFSFEIRLPNYKGGKESIHQAMIQMIRKNEDRGLFLFNDLKWTSQGNYILSEYTGKPFANLLFTKSLRIGGDSISFTYVEKTDQQVMLPNILFFVYMLLFSTKITDALGGGFDKMKTFCRINTENNCDCYFHDKFSPLEVEYSSLLKYSLNKNSGFEYEMEKKEDVYELFNRFYHQYRTNESQVMPYVSLIKASFDKAYNQI